MKRLDPPLEFACDPNHIQIRTELTRQGIPFLGVSGYLADDATPRFVVSMMIPDDATELDSVLLRRVTQIVERASPNQVVWR